MSNNIPPSFSKFRTALEQEVIRQQGLAAKTPSMHTRRASDSVPYGLNPESRTASVAILNVGNLPFFTLANILLLVFNKDPEEIMDMVWDIQKSGVRSTHRVYLTNWQIAMNKVRQAEGMLWLASRYLKFDRPVFLIEEFNV